MAHEKTGEIKPGVTPHGDVEGARLSWFTDRQKSAEYPLPPPVGNTTDFDQDLAKQAADAAKARLKK